MTLKILLTDATERLTQATSSKGEAQAMVRMIMEHLKGYNPADCVIHSTDSVTPWLEHEVNMIVSRVEGGEPIQYVLGVARFMGNDFKVTHDTLIPRPETAMLVDMITDRNSQRTDLRVLDIGTGSGCIAISLAKALKFAQERATDISPAALEVARQNAAALKAGVTFALEDILSASTPVDAYDIIVSNPPYIAESEAETMESHVKDQEPASALFVPDSNPLLYYKAIAAYAIKALSPAGELYLEINPLFADELSAMLRESGFTEVELHPDFYGKTRFATAKKPANG